MSQYELPYPLPGKYDPSGQFRNPAGTIPRPSPADMPVGAWIGSRTDITNWQADPFGNGRVLWRARWSSPIYDLRPDTGALSDNRNNTTPSGVAVWRAAGQNIAAQLFVQISNPLLAGVVDYRGLQVISQEEAHVVDVTQLDTVTGPQDVTAEFTSRGNSAVVTYSPYGDGYPVKYWRLRLEFQILANQGFPVPGPPPTFTIQAALY